MNEDNIWDQLKKDCWKVEFNVPKECLREQFNDNVLTIENFRTLLPGELVRDDAENSEDETSIRFKCLTSDVSTNDVSINLEFKDYEYENSVLVWMKQWRDLIYESHKENVDNMSEMFDFECSEDGLHTNMYLKKPISELNEDEKERLRNLLTECFGFSEKELKKWKL